MNYSYWLDTPADDWETALPVGNGRLGASVCGRVENERITINEETMWYGKKRERRNPQSGQYVDQIRQMLLKGRVEDAQFLCQMAMTSTPKYLRPYQPACDLNLLSYHGTGPVEEYARQLNLDDATAKVRYKVDDTAYTRDFFVSVRWQVLAMRLTARGKNKLKFQINLNRRPFEQISGGNGRDTVYLEGACGDGVSYYNGAVLGKHDGKACQIGDYLAVWDATEAVIFFDCETSFSGKDPKTVCLERLKLAAEAGYEMLLEVHRKEYAALFGRMTLELEKNDYSGIPVNRLLLRTKEPAVRRYLTQLLFAFGRYLMISSSYACELPANLQGIWNGSYTPPWESKYTININLQMNYWMVDSCGLSECFVPYVKLLDKIVENGKETAREVYGCRGSVAHHNTDCYGNSDIEGLPASAYMWPMGEAWLSLQLYDHYLYTMDEEFLRCRAIPVLEENIRFFYDYLYRGVDGRWLTGPSVSPENTYRTQDGQTASVTMAPAMDNQILRELCSAYLEGTKVLKKTGQEVKMAAEILQAIPPIELSGDGRIREWYQEFEETEKGHRHISQLFALYPGSQIHADTPALWEAAQKTLKVRLENGGGHTGWSRAWLICMFARLWDPRKVGENIRLYLEKSTTENLYDIHPPFQIDGNFGICAGIVEALVQKRRETVYLLPAVPEEWEEGKGKGLHLKGGIVLDLEWNLQEINFRLCSKKGGRITLFYKDRKQILELFPQTTISGRFIGIQ